MGQWLTPVGGGQPVYIPDEAVGKALSSGRYESPDAGATSTVVDPTTDLAFEVPLEQLGEAQRATGFAPETEQQFRTAERSARLEEEHGGIGGMGLTALEQGLDTATFGLSGAIGEEVFGQDYTRERRERLEVNPEAGTIGTLAGAVLPAVVSGGTGGAATVAKLTPAGAAGRAGEAIAALGKGRGVISGTAAAAAGYGVEGALFGAGHVLSETVLHDKELSAEAFMAGAKEGALWGGAGGAAGSLLSRGAKAAANKWDEVISKTADERELASQLKAAQKDADRASRLRDKLILQRDRSLNQRAMQELKDEGRLKVAEVREGARRDIAAQAQETRLAVADKGLEKELAKAEAKAAVARAKVEAVSERLAVEQERTARAGLVMEGRLQLADTYTSGWRRAADSREAVAASKLEAAEIGADAKIRTGLADSLAKTGREDAGMLVEELIPERMRTPKAVKAAQAETMTSVSRLQATTDDLVRQADQLAMLNPMAAEDIAAARQAALESVPAVGAWAEKASQGADDFAGGFKSIRQAEQAQHDLAQAMAPYLDDASKMQLAELTKGMDDAVAKTDEIVESSIAKQVERAASTPSGVAGDSAAVMDLLIGAGGLPNADDIPAIGPVLGAYLKFRAAKGALGRMGIRLPGPVARIAQIGAGVQNKASAVVATVIKRAPEAAKHVERAATPLTSVLSRPLWEPAEDEAKEPAKKRTPLQQYQRRADELERAVADLDETHKRVMDSVPAPPSVQAAIADATVRKLEYLASVMPKDPRPPSVRSKPYQPNPVELQRFREQVYATESPVDAMRQIMDGTLSPQAAEAVKAVYPRLFAAMQEELIENIAESDEPPVYERLVRAALVWDVPLDSTTLPSYYAARQEEYALMAQMAPPPARPPAAAAGTLSKLEETGPMRRAMR